MQMENEVSTPLMQRARTQAEVLVPVLQHLRAELGAAEANALIYPVLRECARKWIAEMASEDSDDPIANWQRTSEVLGAQYEGDVAYEIVRHDEEALDLNVSSCRYAEFFRRLGEPELGAILVCELDDHIADRAAPNLKFSRPDTLMQGGKSCPFRYRFMSGEN